MPKRLRLVDPPVVVVVSHDHRLPYPRDDPRVHLLLFVRVRAWPFRSEGRNAIRHRSETLIYTDGRPRPADDCSSALDARARATPRPPRRPSVPGRSAGGLTDWNFFARAFVSVLLNGTDFNHPVRAVLPAAVAAGVPLRSIVSRAGPTPRIPHSYIRIPHENNKKKKK